MFYCVSIRDKTNKTTLETDVKVRRAFAENTSLRIDHVRSHNTTVVKRRYSFNPFHSIPRNKETLYTMLTVITE